MSDKEVYKKTIELFDGKCVMCGSPNIALHHIRYGACGRHTYIGNVIPLCKTHHDLVHTNKKKYQPMLIRIMEEKLYENNIEHNSTNNK